MEDRTGDTLRLVGDTGGSRDFCEEGVSVQRDPSGELEVTDTDRTR